MNLNSDPNRRNRLGVRFLKYSIYGWSIPLIFVIVAQIIDNMSNLPEYFVKPEFAKACYFYSMYTSDIINLWFYVEHIDSL